jgi:hypothetical protein
MKNTFTIKKISEIKGKVILLFTDIKKWETTVTQCHSGWQNSSSGKESDLETFLGRKVDNSSHIVTQNEKQVSDNEEHVKNTETHRETVSNTVTQNKFQLTHETL